VITISMMEQYTPKKVRKARWDKGVKGYRAYPRNRAGMACAIRPLHDENHPLIRFSSVEEAVALQPPSELLCTDRHWDLEQEIFITKNMRQIYGHYGHRWCEDNETDEELFDSYSDWAERGTGGGARTVRSFLLNEDKIGTWRRHVFAYWLGRVFGHFFIPSQLILGNEDGGDSFKE
jgi:hypothetical protein